MTRTKITGVLALLLAMTVFFACKKNPIAVSKLEINNESGQELVLQNTTTGEKFSIGSGQSKLISTNLTIDRFSIEAPAGDQRTFSFQQSGDQKYTILGYMYLLEYKISGQDTKTASISFLDDQGNSVEVPSVNLPYQLSYKKISGKKWALSAANLEKRGNISIQVLVKGKVKSDLSNPQNVATSGSVD